MTGVNVLPKLESHAGGGKAQVGSGQSIGQGFRRPKDPGFKLFRQTHDPFPKSSMLSL